MTESADETHPAGGGPTAPVQAAMSHGYEPDALRRYYGEWAESYDVDMAGPGADSYGLPSSIVTTLEAAGAEEPSITSHTIDVLDAGCGTGLVGAALRACGYTNIDGVDLSPEMVEQARKTGIYRRLEAPFDLSIPPSEGWRQHYDLVTVGGVFTVEHVHPEALRCAAQLVRPGGVLVTSVRPAYFADTAYEAVSDDMVATGAADLLARFDSLPYTADTTGLYFAYRIN